MYVYKRKKGSLKDQIRNPTLYVKEFEELQGCNSEIQLFEGKTETISLQKEKTQMMFRESTCLYSLIHTLPNPL